AEELEILRALLAQVQAGEGQVALVGGDAGAGKSRLVRELAQEAAGQGVLVLHGGADPTVDAPYKPFVEALEFLVNVSEPTALKAYVGTAGRDLARPLPHPGTPGGADGGPRGARPPPPSPRPRP